MLKFHYLEVCVLSFLVTRLKALTKEDKLAMAAVQQLIDGGVDMSFLDESSGTLEERFVKAAEFLGKSFKPVEEPVQADRLVVCKFVQNAFACLVSVTSA